LQKKTNITDQSKKDESKSTHFNQGDCINSTETLPVTNNGNPDRLTKDPTPNIENQSVNRVSTQNGLSDQESLNKNINAADNNQQTQQQTLPQQYQSNQSNLPRTDANNSNNSGNSHDGNTSQNGNNKHKPQLMPISSQSQQSHPKVQQNEEITYPQQYIPQYYPYVPIGYPYPQPHPHLQWPQFSPPPGYFPEYIDYSSPAQVPQPHDYVHPQAEYRPDMPHYYQHAPQIIYLPPNYVVPGNPPPGGNMNYPYG